MSAPKFVIRAAGGGDLAGFQQLRALAGPGFTSLQVDDAGLAARLTKSEKSFASTPAAPGDERYLLVMDEIAGEAACGCVGVKATIGASPPFFNFRVIKIAQASSAGQRRFDMDVLVLVNEFTGCSEVGSLFVRPNHRSAGVGRMLAQSRYLMMAADPRRFCEKVVSELRGVISPEGRAPFWEHLGRHFFKMSFHEADRLSAFTDNQFILDLMPKYPIYVDLLPNEARAVIGECHVDGRGARKLLEWEGFRYDSVVDIFDGGPLLSVSRDAIRTLRETRRLPLYADESTTGRRALIAAPTIANFRCAPTLARIEDGKAFAHPAALEAIGVCAGEEALVWIEDAA